MLPPGELTMKYFRMLPSRVDGNGFAQAAQTTASEGRGGSAGKLTSLYADAQ